MCIHNARDFQLCQKPGATFCEFGGNRLLPDMLIGENVIFGFQCAILVSEEIGNVTGMGAAVIFQSMLVSIRIEVPTSYLEIRFTTSNRVHMDTISSEGNLVEVSDDKAP